MLKVPMIDTVFLDVDGVLADFDGGVSKWYGVPQPPRETWGYNYQEEFGMSGSQFWAGLTEDFWAGLEKLPWADDLVGWLENRFPGKVVFLTSPPLNGGASGKQEWLRENYPRIFGDKRYLIGPGKSHVARAKALLIDDHDENTAKFRQADGKVVTFPQRWNRNAWVLDDPNTDRMHFTKFAVDWIAYGGD